MEHRHGARVNDQVFITLIHRGKRLGRFPTLNFSFQGMYLETGSLAIRRHDIIDLLVDIGSSQGRRMRGLVVRKDRQGVAILLCEEHPLYQRLVLARLNHRRRPAYRLKTASERHHRVQSSEHCGLF
ncbi:MAG: hypothetical protein JXM75_11440 [Chromatiaceae bacterium]|nr:hypothetical protein [Chromatiaceae bacterium]